MIRGMKHYDPDRIPEDYPGGEEAYRAQIDAAIARLPDDIAPLVVLSPAWGGDQANPVYEGVALIAYDTTDRQGRYVALKYATPLSIAEMSDEKLASMKRSIHLAFARSSLAADIEVWWKDHGSAYARIARPPSLGEDPDDSATWAVRQAFKEGYRRGKGL